MTGHEKIKNLIVELWQKKRKAVLCVLLVEALLLFMGILGLFGKNRVYEFGTEAMQGNFGSPVEETGGYRVTEADGARGNLVDFTGLALPKGVYKAVTGHLPSGGACGIWRRGEPVSNRAYHFGNKCLKQDVSFLGNYRFPCF